MTNLAETNGSDDCGGFHYRPPNRTNDESLEMHFPQQNGIPDHDEIAETLQVTCNANLETLATNSLRISSRLGDFKDEFII